ncbi:protein of unknown function [Cupriavidus taiwanensis]|nr:protein of unknown function [Cupriavidus taiwanensis]
MMSGCKPNVLSAFDRIPQPYAIPWPKCVCGVCPTSIQVHLVFVEKKRERFNPVVKSS